jgi:hypothetical protein
MNTVLPGFGVDVTYVNCWKTDEILAEIDKGLTLLYLESPTNPLLRVVDVPTLASAAHAKGAVVLLDATFASPINQHPVNGKSTGDSQRYQIPGRTPRRHRGLRLLQQALRGPHLEPQKNIRRRHGPHDRLSSPFAACRPLNFAFTSTIKTPWRSPASWKHTPTLPPCTTRACPPIRTTTSPTHA